MKQAVQAHELQASKGIENMQENITNLKAITPPRAILRQKLT
jgi:hypothetical protein